MTILEQIIQTKRQHLDYQKATYSYAALENRQFFSRSTLSLKANLLAPNSSGIIAEFKRQSPSEGVIHTQPERDKISSGYAKAGAAGMSILTDQPYFNGTNEDLIRVRQQVDLPLLRKDFIIDEFQIVEAKSLGADVVLLIAAVLNRTQIIQFTKLAHSLGLEVLLEVKNKEELERCLHNDCELIGVNNRDLRTFNVNFKKADELAEFIPKSIIKVAESGIDNPYAVRLLQVYGYRGFLIGSHFMRQQHPASACRAFIKELHHLNHQSV